MSFVRLLPVGGVAQKKEAQKVMLMDKGNLPRLFAYNTGRVRKRRKTMHGRCIVETEELDDEACEYG